MSDHNSDKRAYRISDILDRAAETYRSRAAEGKQATYIPELANVDGTLFSVSATTIDGRTYSAGDSDTFFSMQSISKVISLIFAIEEFGADKVFARVGMEPCSEPFNSIMKLEMTSKIPLNPFINSGAIVIADMILERFGKDAAASVIGFASRITGRAGAPLAVNEKVFLSEKYSADRNRSLAYFMHGLGELSCGVDDVLDLYFGLCSVEANTDDLSVLGATIANAGLNPLTGSRAASVDTMYIVSGLMSVCGLYDESGEFAVKVGIPAKSGVSGGIVCAVPGKMGLATFSPPLDKGGSSVAGILTLSYLSREMKLRGI